jgi:serine phosphatase RsbU (regulator of sigma subunit)
MAEHVEHSGRRHILGILLILIAVSIPFYLLYTISRRAILQEVRSQAMGVAIATAQGIDPDLFFRASREEDPGAIAIIREHLDRISEANPDVRFIYTMRRASDPLAPTWRVEYVVDQSARDFNDDGTITPDEDSEPSGALYDSRRSPELIRAFDGPTADFMITPDPPYPDLISGYAPISGAAGIVGVDITARTVATKMRVMTGGVLLAWVVVSGLMTCVYLLYLLQRAAFHRNAALGREVAGRNELLRAANQELARMNQRFEADLQLAQRVQQGFLPTRFPRHDRVVFDQYYLTCDILGGDLYDVFEIDHDHVGLYIADVAGHGVSAALISGLLKMAVATVQKQPSSVDTVSLVVDLTRPDQFLHSINDLLHGELPEDEFITMIYGVLDLLNNRLVLASAGHPPPLIRRADGSVRACELTPGMALGIEPDRAYAATEHPVGGGDTLLFYTDGLTEAMDPGGEEFGFERVIEVASGRADGEAAALNLALREAVCRHRAGREVSDDFTLLAVEVR